MATPDKVGTDALRILALPRASRFRRSKLFKDLGNSYGYWPLNRSIPSAEDDLFHRVQHGEQARLDVLAWKFYQNPYFWWVIALANGIIDPFTQPVEHQLLRIPSLSNILSRLTPS